MNRRPGQTRSLASLPWYDLREIRSDTDIVWRELARRFVLAGLTSVPKQLNRDMAYESQWTSSAFLFGQACGYDVRLAYAGYLQVVATPCYDAPGCEGSNYSSLVVVRQDSPFDSVEDLRGTRCVINTPTSHSGMNVLRALVAPLHCEGRFFSSVCMSGSHERSLRMIGRGEVDVAAIDCVTHALLARHRPWELSGTRILHRTQQVPSPPYVTASTTTPETLITMRAALRHALDHPALASAKAALMLSGIEVLPEEAYTPIESLAAMAHHHNYREIPGQLDTARSQNRALDLAR
jgi:ABC-type phosphate/phosphonate transport system substrate-binding protein